MTNPQPSLEEILIEYLCDCLGIYDKSLFPPHIKKPNTDKARTQIIDLVLGVLPEIRKRPTGEWGEGWNACAEYAEERLNNLRIK